MSCLFKRERASVCDRRLGTIVVAGVASLNAAATLPTTGLNTCQVLSLGQPMIVLDELAPGRVFQTVAILAFAVDSQLY